MPLYEYQCDACGHRFEVIQKFSDPPLETCPKCGGARCTSCCRRPAIQFKGSGWYITDYAKKDQGSRGDGEIRRRRRRPRRRRAAPTRREKGEKAETKTDRVEKSATRATTKPSRPKTSTPSTPSRRASTTPAEGVVGRLYASPTGAGRSSDVEVGRELVGEVGPPQREVDHRLQEPQLVAGVVADALHLAGVDRPRLQQLAQAVGQLDLAGAVALGRRQRREDVGRQDVAADDRQVRRRFVARRLLDQIAHPVDALAEIDATARARSRRSSRSRRVGTRSTASTGPSDAARTRRSSA